MNKRIRELAEACVREVDNVDLDSPLQERIGENVYSRLLFESSPS
jgi:hypothetical protein